MSFHEGPIDGLLVRPLKRHCDNRGWLVELFREDELLGGHRPVMAYVSQTLPGVARGPHEHRDQADLFAFLGPGEFKLYCWDRRPTSPTRGHQQIFMAGESRPLAVLVPAGVVHAYKNVGSGPGLVYNFPDRLYAGPGRCHPVDEIRYEDLPNSPFVLD